MDTNHIMDMHTIQAHLNHINKERQQQFNPLIDYIFAFSIIIHFNKIEEHNTFNQLIHKDKHLSIC